MAALAATLQGCSPEAGAIVPAGSALAAFFAAPYAVPGAVVGAIGVAYKVYFIHGVYDTALTFIGRVSGRMEEYVDETFEGITIGTQRLCFALTLMLTFLCFVCTFYLTARVYVELKKFMWAWPSPHAHAARERDQTEEERASGGRSGCRVSS